ACDVAESCNGTADACPQDAFASSETVCRPSASICDAPESCSGLSRTCPTDRARAPGFSCREGNGTCDPGETCNGISFECPANVYTERGVGCSEDPTCDQSPCACDGVGLCLSACGNGDLDEGEECDDGELNGQRDRCTMECQAVCGGEPTWVTGVGGYGPDRVNDLATELGGRGYAVGTYSPDGEWGFGAWFGESMLSYFGGNDAFILGHDASGEVQWASCVGGWDDDLASGVASDGTGVYMVGSFRSVAQVACCDDFPTAPQLPDEDGCAEIGSWENEDSSENMYIARWSDEGDFEWVVEGGRPWTRERANGVATDPLGWAFVVGQIDNDGESNNTTMFGNLELDGFGGYDAFVAGFNRFGVGTMAVVIGGEGYERATSVVLDGGDGVYVLVEAESDFSFGDSVIEVGSENELILFALDRQGGYRWHRTINEALDLDGEYFNGGSIAYGCRLATGSDGQCGIHVLASTYSDLWVARFDLSGNLDWTADVDSFGEIWAGDLAVERNGRVTVTGAFSGTAVFGEDELEAEEGGGGSEFFARAPGFEGSGDIYVARLDAGGEWLWAKRFGSDGRDYGGALGLDDRGAAYVA
ncbi:MAG TPA: hypothetical protein PK095_08340, partial [Myxococcota bacterium]|nr:hypothetical protein [Myxococcota bacterium]